MVNEQYLQVQIIWKENFKISYLDIRIAFFEVTTSSRNSPTGANPCNKYVHLAFCIFPYLRASGFIVNLKKAYTHSVTNGKKLNKWDA